MSTTILHSNVQRSRFAHHSLAAIIGLIPALLLWPLKATRPVAARTAVEVAGLEAQKVRDLAQSYTKTDPGFAADLYAAAARHESLNDA
jgi:hypothetical protein